MADRGYDVVVDVDTEPTKCDFQGDLGHTDLQEDNLEFHPSNRNGSRGRADEVNSQDFDNDANTKIQQDSSTTPFLSSNTNPSNLPNSNNNNLNTLLPSSSPSDPSSSKRYLWTLSFYAQYFDVDTTTVLTRCRAALLPFLPHTGPFLDTLDGNPDLYGPFWIATTVVVILFLTGTISRYLAQRDKGHFAYDFQLLSGAAGLIYGYSVFVPAALWALLRWFGAPHNEVGGEGGGIELVESWALYGYANLVWIIVALLSWSPLNALNYALVALGYALSVFFLVKNLYPIISATDKKTSQTLLLAVVILHAGLAVAIKILFFAHASPARKDDGKNEESGNDRSLLLP